MSLALWNQPEGFSFASAICKEDDMSGNRLFFLRKARRAIIMYRFSPTGKEIILKRYLNDQASNGYVDPTQVGFINQALGHLQQEVDLNSPR